MTPAEAVYGFPPAALALAAADAAQVSPLAPDGHAIEALAAGSLARMVVAAPAGTIERRYALAHALRALRPHGELIALAPRDKGGARLRRELEALGCAVNETARRHYRVCMVRRPDDPVALDVAIAAGGLQIAPELGVWSQPGVFSWDRLDPGSALLIECGLAFSGRGADLGCGVGVLARAVLASPRVSELTLIDIDRRAVEAASRNVVDPRARFIRHDLRVPPHGVADLDFVITNPPFHDAGAEDRGLGRVFVAAAAAMLRSGGVLRLVANVALPYETTLAGAFSKVSLVMRAGGYKVLEARR